MACGGGGRGGLTAGVGPRRGEGKVTPRWDATAESEAGSHIVSG
jgi:hypothetical protein